MNKLPPRARKLIYASSFIGTTVGAIVLWKDKLAGEVFIHQETKSDKVEKESYENHVFIVTGANSGIGQAMATELAHMKAKVYMACRNLKKCEETREKIVLESRNKYVYCRKCDLTSLNSIREFVKAFKANEKHLNGLINNAGVMHHHKMLTEDGMEIHLATNAFGPFLLTDLLVDTLKQTPKSRIINLINLDFRKGDVNFDDLNFESNFDRSRAFKQSQLMIMLLMREWAEKLAPSGVSIMAAYPGVVSTGIKRHMGVDKSISGTLISSPLLWFLTKRPERGAQTPLYLALKDDVKEFNGRLFTKLEPIDVECDKAVDDQAAKRLFAIAKYWTGQVSTKKEAAQLV